jgi:predicted GNAT superfamily acetyltransferase
MNRPPAAEDLVAMVALNNEFVTETSFLTPDAMRHLIGAAFHVRVAGETEAFCIALDQAANHDSPNLEWFRQRLERFVYIDRIIVAAHARGRGIAQTLYRDLIAAAKNAGHTVACCEVNISPPNPGSDRFHDAFGFVEIGRAFLADRAKTVRYLTLEI